MAVVSTGQITITDVNDYTYQGTTAPKNPIPNVTVWIDTSVSPSVMKRWTGTTWEIVNEVIIGGRNLLLNSKNEWNLENAGWVYVELANKLEAGKTYILSAKFFENIGNTSYAIGLNLLGGVGYYFSAIPLNEPFIATEVQATKTHLSFANQTGAGKVSIHYPKLELGNKATDWTPAPEDIDSKISAEAQKIIALEGKTNFLGSTTIDGNVVATGTLLVGNESGGNAGITGAGASGSSTRFYAGSNYAGRDYANWRMRDDGVEEQWTLWNGQRKIVRRRGQIGNKYQDILYNPEDGSIAKITTVVDGYVEEQWYKNGQIVYSVGSGGIYYVAEIAESWTTHSSKLLTSTASQTDAQLVTLLKNLLVFTEYKDAGYGDYATIEIDTPNPFYRYHAGQNVYSESNKQYEKYYFNQKTSKTGTKLADGWYNIGFSANTEDIPSGGGNANYNFTTDVFRILSGEVAESRTLTITGTYYIHPLE